MDNFIELIKEGTISTIEGLLGMAPEVSLKDREELQEHSTVVPPAVLVDITVEGEGNGKMQAIIPPTVATALSDMMMGGEGIQKEEMEEDDLDATKEIISNILGAVSSTLSAQNELPKMNFTITDIAFKNAESTIYLGDFKNLLVYDFSIGDLHNVIMFTLDAELIKSIEGAGVKESAAPAFESHQSSAPAPQQGGNFAPAAHLGTEEMRNISLLMDVRLTIRVRIGSKKMLLRDVINMDIGSIIELNQLANEPLDILVDNKKIAEGEVVIVDGNFGIQITTIGSKKERLEQLKN
jgi:flagellar motor switch protein FliN/FliY